jgi:hypothetical protein
VHANHTATFQPVRAGRPQRLAVELLGVRFPDCGRILDAPRPMIVRCDYGAVQKAFKEVRRQHVVNNVGWIRLVLTSSLLEFTKYDNTTEACVELPVNYAGAPFETAFSAWYLWEAINALAPVSELYLAFQADTVDGARSVLVAAGDSSTRGVIMGVKTPERQ